ncbi:hypothetical protein SAMN04487944_11532 [Gracilibacillus ureilyticus]|uniref:Uncharacterized protein n=1 Tax=Gracilibacillus ureilyticus TaxID=531814 RepID=A0A1H9TX73_9BACI|nr:hypothetical protein SAMN04487944_11532 [Gracilibacillus ureilyticus]
MSSKEITADFHQPSALLKIIHLLLIPIFALFVFNYEISYISVGIMSITFFKVDSTLYALIF